MSNAFNKGSLLWEVDTAGTLVANAPGMTVVWVSAIFFVPDTTEDSVTFQTGASEDAIYVKARGTEECSEFISFPGKGRRVPGLKCSAISTSAKAYVYLS